MHAVFADNFNLTRSCGLFAVGLDACCALIS